jgi:hypothetical protein
MCTTVALETALRACIRKTEGVNCAAIAVDASFFQEAQLECGPEALHTRILRAIAGGRLFVQTTADEQVEPAIDCNSTPSTEELLQSVLLPSSDGKVVVAVMADTSDVDDCVSDCSKADMGLEELFRRSLVYSDYFAGNAVRVIYNDASENSISCAEDIPLATLLKMCAFHRGDGSVAWRLQIEVS